MKFKQALLGLMLGGMLIISAALAMAQPGGTRPPRDPAGAQQTAQALATQQAAQASMQLTAVAATAQAITTQADTQRDNIALTVEAVSTSVPATMTAIFNTIPTQISENLPEELEELIEYFVENGDVYIYPETGNIIMSFAINEQDMTDLINLALDQTEYASSNAIVDFTAPAFVSITIDNIEVEGMVRPATVELQFELIEEDGLYRFVLIGVSVNGIPVPLDSIDEALQEAINDVLNQSLSVVVPTGVTPDDVPTALYIVEFAEITDTEFIVIASLDTSIETVPDER